MLCCVLLSSPMLRLQVEEQNDFMRVRRTENSHFPGHNEVCEDNLCKQGGSISTWKIKIFGAATDGDKQWSKALKAYLTKEGATPISSLGSHVKKPPGVNRKLKKLLEDHKDFALDDKGIVTLAS